MWHNWHEIDFRLRENCLPLWAVPTIVVGDPFLRKIWAAQTEQPARKDGRYATIQHRRAGTSCGVSTAHHRQRTLLPGSHRYVGSKTDETTIGLTP